MINNLVSGYTTANEVYKNDITDVNNESIDEINIVDETISVIYDCLVFIFLLGLLFLKVYIKGYNGNQNVIEFDYYHDLLLKTVSDLEKILNNIDNGNSDIKKESMNLMKKIKMILRILKYLK